MYRRSFGPFTAAGLLAALLAAAWIYSPETTPAFNADGSLECEARFDPATIEAGTVHEEVAVNLTESIGEIHEVDTPENSGLTVLWIHNDADPEPAQVRVSALGAEFGEWEVTLLGMTGECTGRITVVNGD